jgi:hypothetical protein
VSGPLTGASLFYLVAEDCWYLVSEDRTACVRLPQELTTTLGELVKPESWRVANDVYGTHLLPWPPR